MPARSKRSPSTKRTGGRVTPKGTRPTGAEVGAGGDRRSAPVIDRSEFGHDPNRGTRQPAFRPVAPRAGNRGNR
jgi:hypothetical protein